ncbi:MAG: hypothetical protein RMY33_007870 [Nostoc sp. DedQUE03]|nr:hypothetical protein [Nostoc sp. DedQUE02]
MLLAKSKAVMGCLGYLGALAELNVSIAVSIHPTFAQLNPNNSLVKERSQIMFHN